MHTITSAQAEQPPGILDLNDFDIWLGDNTTQVRSPKAMKKSARACHPIRNPRLQPIRFNRRDLRYWLDEVETMEGLTR